MMIAMLVRTVKICGWRMLISRIPMDRTPVTTAGTTGVLRLGWTFASRVLNGRPLSRAIAYTMRIVAVWTARQHAVTARTMAFGAVSRGSIVSSPSELAVSKPYITYAEASEATRKAPR